MLEVQNIKKSFGNLAILNGVSFEVAKGQIASIVGASGAGKSTLLHIIGTLDNADEGDVIIDGVSTRQLKGKNMSSFRNQEIGFVFQFHHLLPEFSAVENVAIPMMIAGITRKKSLVEAEKLLVRLNLKHRLTHKPSELSGGEQQRVAIARALINKPSVLLADEPTGNLDSKNSQELIEYLLQLRDELNQTIVFVTHDLALADKSDIQLRIKDGMIDGR